MSESAHDRRERSGVAAAALGALVPGLGHGYLGRWRIAFVMVLPLIALVGLGVYAVTQASLVDVASWVVRPQVLMGILAVNVVIVVWRVVAVADPYRVSHGRHTKASLLLVTAMALLVAAPHVLIAKYTLDAAYVLDEVFVDSNETIVAQAPAYIDPEYVVPDPATTRTFDAAEPVEHSARNLMFREGIGDPDATAHSMEYRQQREATLASLIGQEADGLNQITILLVGGDGGPGRGGSRADTIMVATFDTETGKASIFGIPRNMTHVPLPDQWSTAFVDLEKKLTPWDVRRTWTDEDGDGEPDQFEPCHCFPDQINAIYPFTRGWTETYPDEVDPGLAALRDTLEILLGLDIDYYAMVNMSGFVRVVDALGGIRVYVTGYVQTEVSPAREGEDWIEVEISPGWNRLNGHEALAYVRERKSTSDYVRMKRQRCLLKAVAAQADPATILTRFSSISRAFGSAVKTNINIDFLPTLLEHAASLDFSDIATVGIDPPFYTPELDHRGKPTPDLNRIQAIVQWALNADVDTEFATGSDSECRI